MEKEIWLIFYRKNTKKPTIFYEDALDEALCFGWIDGKLKKLDKERYMIRFTPRRPKSQWSANNVARYRKLLKEGLVTNAGREAFGEKAFVYTSRSNRPGAIDWHLAHKMPKNPTQEERITWHIEHQKYCGCRPIPQKLIGIIGKRGQL